MDHVFHDNSMDMEALNASYYNPQRCRSRGGGQFSAWKQNYYQNQGYKVLFACQF